MLLAGLMPETPLGRVIAIRSARDPKSDGERRILVEWDRFKGNDGVRALEQALERMFGTRAKLGKH